MNKYKKRFGNFLKPPKTNLECGLRIRPKNEKMLIDTLENLIKRKVEENRRKIK